MAAVFSLLVNDLEHHGPAPGAGWRHYGKLRTKSGLDCRHCHLIVGRPTYVCCWEVVDKKNKVIEAFAKKIKVTQANLSNMENGRRPIGKIIAKRIEAIFKVDYRLFL